MLPSGKLTWLLNMAIEIVDFPIKKQWFSMVMLVYWRVQHETRQSCFFLFWRKIWRKIILMRCLSFCFSGWNENRLNCPPGLRTEWWATKSFALPLQICRICISKTHQERPAFHAQPPWIFLHSQKKTSPGQPNSSLQNEWRVCHGYAWFCSTIGRHNISWNNMLICIKYASAFSLIHLIAWT